MPERKTIEVRVPVKMKDQTTKWLRADGELGEEPEAVTFVFHASPTPREMDQIERKEHDYFGLREYVDLQRSIEGARQRLLSVIETELWPEGERPEVTGQALIDQEKEIQEALARSTAPERDYYSELSERRERLNFWARWEVLGVDHPEGWDRISEREMTPLLFRHVWNAYTTALEGYLVGKGAPSRS